jgi:hypothetical protein
MGSGRADSNSGEALDDLDVCAKPLKKQKKNLVRVRQVKGKKNVTGLSGSPRKARHIAKDMAMQCAVVLQHKQDFKVADAEFKT